MHERRPPRVADDLRADDDVAELARQPSGSSSSPSIGNASASVASSMPRCSRFSARLSSGATNASPSSPSRRPPPRAPAARARRAPPRRRRHPMRFSTSTSITAAVAVPVSSACCLYASTMRWTSLWRTTSSWPKRTKAMPSIVAEDVLHLDQPGRLLARQVDLRHVAGDDDLRAEAEAGEEHLHLLRRGVLRLVEDDEAVVERASAHEGERRDLDGPALHVRVQLLGIHHVVERVEERAHVRVDLREQSPGRKPSRSPASTGGPREDDAADLPLGERGDREGDREVRLACARRADPERHREIRIAST